MNWSSPRRVEKKKPRHLIRIHSKVEVFPRNKTPPLRKRYAWIQEKRDEEKKKLKAAEVAVSHPSYIFLDYDEMFWMIRIESQC